MKLGIDIDGCLSNFTKAYAKALVDVTGRNLLPEGFTGDNDSEFPKSWYWERELGYTKEEEEATWNKAILSSDTFWAELEPLPGAQEALTQLSRLQQRGNHVFFITHRFGNKVRHQTECFLNDNGFAHNPLVVISGDKAPIINALGVEFFIDDKLSTIQDVAKKCNPTHLFLKDALYNRTDVEVARRIASVSDALKEVGLWQEKRPVGRPRKTQ